jgi:hypothetical protein
MFSAKKAVLEHIDAWLAEKKEGSLHEPLALGERVPRWLTWYHPFLPLTRVCVVRWPPSAFVGSTGTGKSLSAKLVASSILYNKRHMGGLPLPSDFRGIQVGVLKKLQNYLMVHAG